MLSSLEGVQLVCVCVGVCVCVCVSLCCVCVFVWADICWLSTVLVEWVMDFINVCFTGRVC